jgi:uncharacterized protein involved in response to NO
MNRDRHENATFRVLFAYGFRPFFLLAGLYAIAAVTAWLWLYRNGTWPLPSLPPQLWHGHEMIFGFIGAAIAGFLLTAVPSWTGSRAQAGRPLIGIAMLWLAGRFAFSLGEVVPLWLLATAELGFVPALALAIAPSLLRAANRNWPMLVLLAGFWAADLAFVLGLANRDPMLGRTALLAAMDIVLLLDTIIGGRIVPAFSGNALRASGVQAAVGSNPHVERLVLPSMIAMLLCDTLLPGGHLAMAIAAIAAGLHTWRLAGWHGWQTLRQPIVWVLHLAYLWLPLGLALKAAWLAGGFGWAAHWLHALGAGAAGMMILAVMTRASLGHTGRPLKVRGLVVAAYALLALAVVVRVFGPALQPINYTSIVLVSAALWIAAFVANLAIYGPILLRPRVDGKPG